MNSRVCVIVCSSIVAFLIIIIIININIISISHYYCY